MSRKGTLTTDIARPSIERPEMAPDRVLDRTQLFRSTGDDTALAREVLDIFVQHADRMLASMPGDGAGEDRRIAVHGMRGAALAIGAIEVARRAAALETALLAAEPGVPDACDAGPDRAELTDAFVAAIGQARAEIILWLAEVW